MKVDFEALISNFRDAKEGTTFKRARVSDYVMSHILEPLQRDDALLYKNLDFTRFNADDLQNLMSYLEDDMRMAEKLADLNRVFCRAEPASVGRRAFC